MIKPDDLLDEGRALLGLPASTRSEARRRTIVGRSYYSAFHHLRSHAVASGFALNRDQGIGVHRALLNHLRKSRDRTVLFAAHLMAGLYGWRITADYRMDEQLPEGIEEHCFEDAETVLIELLPDPSS